MLYRKIFTIFILYASILITNYCNGQTGTGTSGLGKTVGSRGYFWTVGAGVSVPVIESGFGDNYHAGFNIHGSGGYLLNNTVGIGGHLQYNSFTAKDVSSTTLSITSFTANVIAGDFRSGSKINPYGVAGLGAYFLSVSSSYGDATFSVSETNLGFRVGGGLNFKVAGRIGVYGEVTLDDNFNDGYAKGYLVVKSGVMFLP